jgi:AmmeMemoRadiSam system protein B
MAIRKHNFSGIPWYEHTKESLLKQIENCFNHSIGPKILPNKSNRSKKHILGVVSPHAGFSCSGPHAAHGFLELSKIDDVRTVVILGTNHTGLGPLISVFPKGSWETPLGSVQIDEILHDLLFKISNNGDFDLEISIDEKAHITEHSIDNQIPFLQYIYNNSIQILPICLGIHSLNACEKLSDILSELVNKSGNKICFVASSDFTHYLTPKEAEVRDRPVINELLEGNLKEAERKQMSLGASICGFGPILTLFSLGKRLAFNNRIELIYGHSGQTCSSNNQVVAYASIIIEK